MEDTHHFSQIRIGNRVIYNGVNGDAFSFGDKPSPSSSSSDSVKKDRTLTLRAVVAANGSSVESTDVTRNSSMGEASARTAGGTSSGLSEGDCHVQKTSSLSEMNPLRSSPETRQQLQLFNSSTHASPLLMSTRRLGFPSPTAVGLPPVLPPPPAAHLPPPLPSRPPSAVPSPSSSVSSLLSFKNDDKSSVTPPPSPTQSLEAGDTSPSNNAAFRNFFFRSSGTIKVEAPSRDLPHSPTHPPLSPPPLPMPAVMASTSPPSAHLIVSKQVSETRAKAAPSSEPQASEGTTQKATPVGSFLSTASPSSHNESENEDTDLVDSNENTVVNDGQLTSSANGDVPEGSLVSTRDRNSVRSKKRSSLVSEKSDGNRHIIPPEFDTIRKQSMTYADIISSVLLFYKLSTGSKKKKLPYVQPRLEKATQCRKCGRSFGFRCFRYHCSRCKKAFCDTCIPVMRVDTVEREDGGASSLSRVCHVCSEEIAFETSRGTYRGLWSDFQRLRQEARAQRGLDVTSSNIHKTLESQTMLDVTPGLTSLSLRFLVDVHHQLEKQPRHKFLANYLHFENSGQNRMKNKPVKSKECQACHRQLRMLTDIHDCSLCEQTFCLSCTYRTLQLYLPPGTDLKGDIQVDWIQFHVKNHEQEDGKSSEASETYRVCADCEDDVMRNFRVYDFNRKIPELEAEMFDLQRQIDHALTYATNVKLANRLYGRYMRAYDTLNHMEPQTPGQKTLHRHIKQTMYDFYLKRRNQLKDTLGDNDSWTTTANETP